MLTVAVLDHTAELGGAELALARLLEHLDRDRFDVTVVLFSPGPLVDRLRRSGHRVEVLPLDSELGSVDRRDAGGVKGLLAVLRVLPFAAQLARRLRALDVDVIHTTSLKADLIGVPVALLIRRPLVWHIHDRIAPDYLPPSMVRALRFLARLAPRSVIANSDATAATLPGVRHLTVAHPGLSPDQIATAPRSVPEGPPIVGILGRISPTKAQLDFVRAAAIVRRTCPAARFRIIGQASFDQEDYEREVRAEVHRLGLAEHVDFTGFVPDPTAELDRLTVCVHAASVPEPFGQVIAEAMGRGTPIVATAGGGVDEVLAPGPSGEALGWTVPTGDIRALARAIIEVLADPGEAERRAEAARLVVAQRFPIERTASRVADVWTEAANR